MPFFSPSHRVQSRPYEHKRAVRMAREGVKMRNTFNSHIMVRSSLCTPFSDGLDYRRLLNLQAWHILQDILAIFFEKYCDVVIFNPVLSVSMFETYLIQNYRDVESIGGNVYFLKIVLLLIRPELPRLMFQLYFLI
ncbi:hypothetical protein AVEN_82173-1 [Araneus ventricosus]|uniref:Uncharacterized protein n=1 Tax=Araneus ventricosus TaxID=182803 RepID=A0A4Y2IWI0_ARAVE|nr:hypothetical protein AVEN_82173-1 [Araneus ventricosus]